MTLQQRLRDNQNARRLVTPLCTLCKRPVTVCPAPDDKRVHAGND